MTISKITVNAIVCCKCKDTIFSRARHDFRSCSCGNIFIDGGFDYLRYGGEDLGDIKPIKLKISETKQELFNDWNLRQDKFGLIPFKKEKIKSDNIKNRKVRKDIRKKDKKKV